MATLVRMPGVAANAESASIVAWVKQMGDVVLQGECLAEIETDKAIVELQAEQSGVMGEILVPAGSSVPVGDPVAVLLQDGEEPGPLSEILADEPRRAHGSALHVQVTPAAQPDDDVAPPAAKGPPSEAGRLFASPVARRLAVEAGLDLASLAGSGPNGRIVKNDVLAARALTPTARASAPTTAPGIDGASPTPAAYLEVPHSNMRRTIARRLTESKQSIPHFYLRADCRLNELLELRARINQTAPRKVTVNDFIVKAVGAALRDVPELNVSWTESALRQHQSIDVAVAVSVPQGILTPVINGVDALPLLALSSTIAGLVDKARTGALAPRDYQGGSFSISNLGPQGVREFSAIINPPQSAILAVGAAEDRPVVEHGQLGIATLMTVVLSVDHRAIDGAAAAKWLACFKAMVENPLAALI